MAPLPCSNNAKDAAARGGCSDNRNNLLRVRQFALEHKYFIPTQIFSLRGQDRFPGLRNRLGWLVCGGAYHHGTGQQLGSRAQAGHSSTAPLSRAIVISGPKVLVTRLAHNNACILGASASLVMMIFIGFQVIDWAPSRIWAFECCPAVSARCPDQL